MKILAWISVAYFAATGINNFMSGSLSGTSSSSGGITLSGSSTLRSLPDAGMILGVGTTAGIVDLVIAGGIWFAVLR